MRSIQDEQLRQLRMINAQLNPGPALLKFFCWICGLLFLVFGSFGLMVQLSVHPHSTQKFKPIPARYAKGVARLFWSPCYPPIGVRKDSACK